MNDSCRSFDALIARSAQLSPDQAADAIRAAARSTLSPAMVGGVIG
jgi:hypothetical protein